MKFQYHKPYLKNVLNYCLCYRYILSNGIDKLFLQNTVFCKNGDSLYSSYPYCFNPFLFFITLFHHHGLLFLIIFLSFFSGFFICFPFVTIIQQHYEFYSEEIDHEIQILIEKKHLNFILPKAKPKSFKRL